MRMSVFRSALVLGALVILGLLAAPKSATSQQLVWRPINPAFGGNPLNSQWLLGAAQAQKPAGEANLYARDPLADFQQGLQRQILSALSRELIVNQFGSEIDLTKEARYDLGDFIVEIIPGLNGVDVIVTNVLTGDQTTVTIPQY